MPSLRLSAHPIGKLCFPPMRVSVNPKTEGSYLQLVGSTDGTIKMQGFRLAEISLEPRPQCLETEGRSSVSSERMLDKVLKS